mgnify:CR=1 FL=1
MLKKLIYLTIATQMTLFALLSCTSSSDSDIQMKYQSIADTLIDEILTDDTMWDRLTHLVDYYPRRLSGSQMLEDAIDWMVSEMEQDGFDEVRTQDVMVPHWVRGNEFATLIRPDQRNMPMLGLGGSIGTGGHPIRGEVIVVKDFDELDARSADIPGKIVLFNYEYETYGQAVQYRVHGATRAAAHGAKAALIRSVTQFSMQTPHTGGMRYQEGIPKIPIAAITVEDASYMHRMQNRGETIEVEFYMEAETLPDALSRNIIAEITGSEKPEEIVLIGCHIDSWDVGQGAMDDAGGCLVTWEALRAIHNLGLIPRRTIRLVHFTNEENGIRGAIDYRDKVIGNGEIKQHVLALEVDFGVFTPHGFGFTGSDGAMPVLREIAGLLSSIGVTEVREGSSGTVDIGPLNQEGVPIMGLDVDTERYFWYHHTHADTIDILTKEDVQKCAAAVAVMAFVVADMEQRLDKIE